MFLVGAVPVLFLGACDLAPPPSGSQILDESLPSATRIPEAWSTAGAATTAVGGNWVESFRDPTLSSLVSEAIANNRDLVAAAARVEAALQVAQIAGAPILPWVAASAGGQRTRDLDSDRTLRDSGANIAVAWELDLWGEIRSGQAAAIANATAAANDAVYARQSIAATVARSWIGAIETDQLIAAASDAASQYAQLLELAQQREAAGVVSDFDVVQAEGRLNAAKAALVELRVTRNESVAALEVLLGRYPSLRLKLASSFPRMPQGLSAGLPLSLLDRRPDVIAARDRVVAAFFNTEVAKLAQLPGISLSAAGGRLLDPSLSIVGAGNPDFLSVGVNLLQPIFQGGALQAEEIRMTNLQAAATAAYGQTVLQAYSEAETRLANEQALREALAAWDASYANAQEAVTIGLEDYEAGIIDMVALLNLTEFSIDRRINVIQSRAALLSNRVALYLALGEGY